jgi:hypothetical protein
MFARHPQLGWTVWGDESNEDIVPRGKVHKGYEGGVILPPLNVNVSVPEPVAIEIGHEMRRRYENGASIRGLSEEAGYSIQRVRALLELAETQFRPRGRPVT